MTIKAETDQEYCGRMAKEAFDEGSRHGTGHVRYHEAIRNGTCAQVRAGDTAEGKMSGMMLVIAVLGCLLAAALLHG